MNRSDKEEIIINIAKQLFSEKGYAATGIREIAEKSGLSLGNFYNYFKNKEELFKRLIDPENIIKSLDVIPAMVNEDFPENFDKIIRTIKKVVDMNQELYKLIFIDLIEFGGTNTNNIMDRILQFSNQAFNDDVKSRVVGTKIKEMDYPFYLKLFVTSILPLFIINNILPSAKIPYSDNELSRLIADVLMKGIRV
ncbi:MAG: TetR/AcrR family transcriptional regulator [Spirochaetota bacterium]